MFAIGEIGVAVAFYVELERGLHFEVCACERGVMHLAFAKRPGAWRFVLIDIDVEYLRCTAIAECVALVIAVAALRLQVPSIAHERVHLLIAIECGGPAVESAQRDILGHVRGIPGLELDARVLLDDLEADAADRKSTRLNSSH